MAAEPQATVRGELAGADGNDRHFVGVVDSRKYTTIHATFRVTYINEHIKKLRVVVHQWSAYGWQFVLDYYEDVPKALREPEIPALHAYKMLHD